MEPWPLLVLLLILNTADTSCPKKCTCSHRNVRCVKKGLYVIPASFPPLTTSIDLSGNFILRVKNNSFSSTPYLKKLRLNHNAIVFIEPDAFKGVKRLDQLSLRMNSLGTDKKHSFVNSLSKLTSLTHLQLTANKFKKIPPLVLPALIKLNLDDNHIEDGTFPKSFSQCSSLRSVVLSSNSIKALTSDSFTSIGGVAISNLDFEVNAIKMIDPQAFTPVVDSLVTLSLDHNQLDGGKMLKKMFTSFGGVGSTLDRLSLQFNSIVELKDDTFKGMMNARLKHLHLDGNKIQRLSRHVFTPLKSLQNLTMTECGLTNQLANVDFTKMDGLRKLELGKNSISEIPKQLPVSLRILDLRQNSITAIRREAFKKSLLLETLDIRQNRISMIEKNALMDASRLKVLNLRENNLKNLNLSSFYNLIALEFLDLAKQSAPGLKMAQTGAFKGLTALNHLSLANNALASSLSSDTAEPFLKLTSLRVLDLRDNKLTSLGTNVFKDLSGLQTLNLSSNELVWWKKGTFRALGQLSRLDLSHNRLKFLSVDPDADWNSLGVVAGRLEWLDISSNILNCSCPLHPFIGWLRRRHSIVHLLKHLTCASPIALLNKLITKVALTDGACKDVPNVFPVGPVTVKPSTSTSAPTSEPQSRNFTDTTAAIPPSNSTAEPKIRNATAAVKIRNSTSQAKTGNSTAMGRMGSRRSQSADKSSLWPIVVGVLAMLVGVAMGFGLLVWRWRKSRWKRSPLRSVSERYSRLHFVEEDEFAFNNPSLELRDDDQEQLLSEDVTEVTDNPFPLLNGFPRPQRRSSEAQLFDLDMSDWPGTVHNRPSLSDHNTTSNHVQRPVNEHGENVQTESREDVLTGCREDARDERRQDFLRERRGDVQAERRENVQTERRGDGQDGYREDVESQHHEDVESECREDVESECQEDLLDTSIRLENVEEHQENVDECQEDLQTSEEETETSKDEEEALDLAVICAPDDLQLVQTELTAPLLRSRLPPALKLLSTDSSARKCLRVAARARCLFLVHSRALQTNEETARTMRDVGQGWGGARLVVVQEKDWEGQDVRQECGRTVEWRRGEGVDRRLVKDLREMLIEA